MSSRGRPLERTGSIEDLHELRLMALLHDLVRKHQRKGAGEMLGVDPRTVKACLEQGALSKWMRTALEAQLLSREKAAVAAQQERILNLELAMAEEHGLTLPPETQPLAGVWRNGQRRSIEAALGDTRWARTRRERLRWVRRFFTLGLWWK